MSRGGPGLDLQRRVVEIAHAGFWGRVGYVSGSFVNSVSDVNRRGHHETWPTEGEGQGIRQASDEFSSGLMKQMWFVERIMSLPWDRH
jgi:hypothetical protein